MDRFESYKEFCSLYNLTNMDTLNFEGFSVTTNNPHQIMRECQLYGKELTEGSISTELSKLLGLIGCSHLEVTIDTNVSSWLTIWKIWGRHDQIGQIEARFGSPYSDEPDGYSAYVEGASWTDVCSTVEECAKQLHERKQ